MASDSSLQSTSQTSVYELSYHSLEISAENAADASNSNSILKKLDPQYNNRLFKYILKAASVSGLIDSWIEDYEMDKDQAVQKLLQLFVDLSACQYINLENFLEHNEPSAIVPRMENTNNSIFRETDKYFLKIRSKTFIAKHKKIEEFLINLILKSAKAKILYDFNMIVQPTKLLYEMSKSCLRPIKHTGVHIALKIQTGLVTMSAKILNDIQSCREKLQEDLDNTTANNLEIKQETLLSRYEQLKKMMDFIHRKIFLPNWNFGDSKLYLMRQDCIAEIYQWIVILPERYLQNNSIPFVLKSMTDHDKTVRFTAIDVLSNVLHKFHPKLISKVPKYIVPICARVNDVDYKIAVRAVDALTLASSFTKIPHAVRDKIFTFIYSSNINFALAAACGRFLIQKMKMSIKGFHTEEEMLKMLIHFEVNTNESGIFGRHPFMVEAVIDCMPVLQNVKAYMTLLNTPDVNEKLLIPLMNILIESVNITCTGLCSHYRKQPRKGVVDEEQVESMIKDLILALPRLYMLYTVEQLTPLLLLIHKFSTHKENNNNNVSPK